MSTLLTAFSKGLASRQSLGELAFAERSPKEYAMMLLEQAGISNLESLNSVFIGDPGFDVGVRERSFGRGFEFDATGAGGEGADKVSWFLFERLPGDGGDYLRARVFRSFEGAAAEFAVKLRLHPKGDVKMTESLSSPGTWQLSFSGDGRQMVMAPMDSGLAGGSPTR